MQEYIEERESAQGTKNRTRRRRMSFMCEGARLQSLCIIPSAFTAHGRQHTILTISKMHTFGVADQFGGDKLSNEEEGGGVQKASVLCIAEERRGDVFCRRGRGGQMQSRWDCVIQIFCRLVLVAAAVAAAGTWNHGC